MSKAAKILPDMEKEDLRILMAVEIGMRGLNLLQLITLNSIQGILWKRLYFALKRFIN